jgi:hypothetical protein
MKRTIAACIMILIARPAFALWAKQFGVSDTQYRVWVESNDQSNTTYGFYLTSFPCYAQNSSEYFKTKTGSNVLTLFCLTPPENITLGYITRPNGAFVPKNAKLDGYMTCPVAIAGLGRGDVKPRLAVNIDKCARKSIKGTENSSLIKTGGTFEGKTVGEVMSPKEDEKKPAAAPTTSAPSPQSAGPAPDARQEPLRRTNDDDAFGDWEEQWPEHLDDIDPEDLDYDFEAELPDTGY